MDISRSGGFYLDMEMDGWLAGQSRDGAACRHFSGLPLYIILEGKYTLMSRSAWTLFLPTLDAALAP